MYCTVLYFAFPLGLGICKVEMTTYATLVWVDKLLLFGNKDLNPTFLDLKAPASKHYVRLRRSRVSPVGDMALKKNNGREEPGASGTRAALWPG